jgi:hypothetical protein
MFDRCDECRENPSDVTLDLQEIGILCLCENCLDRVDYDLWRLKVVERRLRDD